MVTRVRVHLEPAYVLHTRPWSETSLLVDVLTQRHGRFRLLAKGARRKKTGNSGELMPFQPLMMSWSGKVGGLATLTSVEIALVTPLPRGAALAAGYYANELLLKMLHRDDPHEDLFLAYDRAVRALGAEADSEAVLRRFECALLKEVGFGLILDHDARNGEVIDTAMRYYYYPEIGPVRAGSETEGESSGLLVSGETLLNLAAGSFGATAKKREAKRLIRALLNHYLSGQVLSSRRVYESMLEVQRRLATNGIEKAA